MGHHPSLNMDRFQIVLALSLVVASYASVSSVTCSYGGTTGCSGQYDASSVNSATTIDCCSTTCSSGNTSCSGYCSSNSDGTCSSGDGSAICSSGSDYVLCSECSSYGTNYTNCYGSCMSQSSCDTWDSIASAIAGWVIAVIVVSCIVVFGIPLLICICCCCCCAAANQKQENMGAASNM